jgi:hypothetical protein
MRTLLLTLAFLGAPGNLVRAQVPVVVAGSVRTSAGVPILGANVFLLETLDGALVDTAGRFTFSTAARGPVTLVVLATGYLEKRTPISLPIEAALDIALDRAPIALAPLRVEAGRFVAGDAPDVALTSLQVVTTPGAAADIYRAIQTFPGLQTADEGAGLFVRGGDVSETRILLNGGIVLSPYRYESPTGGFFGAFDPFLLEGIHFSSGGFSARFGDALSGILDLETLGRPPRVAGGATASLASLSSTVALPLPGGLGVRATATRSHTKLMFEVNGTDTEFTAEPEGRDFSGSAVWRYGEHGEVRVFGIDQWSNIGVAVEEPEFSGAYTADERSAAVVARWRDRIGQTAFSLTTGRATSTREMSLGAFQLAMHERFDQVRGHADVGLSPRWNIVLGGEAENRVSRFEGEFPDYEWDQAPGGATTHVDSDVDGVRTGGFAEATWRAYDQLRITSGLRTDRSSLARQRTWDPRVSTSFRAAGALTLTGAWGIYHQVPGPMVYEPTVGDPSLPPMRATHTVLGGQLGAGNLMLRVEAYRKNYHDLAQTDRDGNVADDGTGDARGFDIFVRWPGWPGLSGRTAYSYIRARRTDPNTGVLARSPLDITHVLTTVLEQQIGNALSVSAAIRSATGRPFTPVVSATHDATRNVWVPQYGPPRSQRLPRFVRIDGAASRLVPLGNGRLLVAFVAVTNLLDRVNVYDVRYSADYRTRTDVRSQFERSFYFGVTVTF